MGSEGAELVKFLQKNVAQTEVKEMIDLTFT